MSLLWFLHINSRLSIFKKFEIVKLNFYFTCQVLFIFKAKQAVLKWQFWNAFGEFWDRKSLNHMWTEKNILFLLSAWQQFFGQERRSKRTRGKSISLSQTAFSFWWNFSEKSLRNIKWGYSVTGWNVTKYAEISKNGGKKIIKSRVLLDIWEDQFEAKLTIGIQNNSFISWELLKSLHFLQK